MTVAELIVALCLLILLVTLLKPLQRFLESALLRFLGGRDRRVIDVSIIEDDKNPPKE